LGANERPDVLRSAGHDSGKIFILRHGVAPSLRWVSG
jgi:hypothetical protein